RAVGVSGGDDHLGEHAGDLFGHFYRDLGVGRDHAAEGGDRVAGVRLGVCLGDRGAHGDAARVGVFDDGHGGRLALGVGGAPGGAGPGGQRGIVGSVSLAGLGPAGSLELGAHPGGHVHVVGGGVPEGVGGEPAALVLGEPAAGYRLGDLAIAGRVHHDGHAVVI